MDKNYKLKNQDVSGSSKAGLYLRVHIMPKLNMPLRGKAWQWISPFVAAAILIVAIFYFFS
jgi:hypothetical protein